MPEVEGHVNGLSAEEKAKLDAERARQHLRLLGEASRRLLQPSGDYRQPLADVVAGLPDDFVSLAAIYLADGAPGDDDLHIVASCAPEGRGKVLALAGDELAPIRATMAQGRSSFVVLEGPRAHHPDNDPVADALAADGMNSYVISPIHVRGLAFGAVLVATAPPIRGYRASDREAIDELSRRIALSIESNQLYREARAKERAAARSASRLRSLLDTKLMISAAGSTRDILILAALGAQQLFPTCHVVATTRLEQYDATGMSGAWLSPHALDRILRQAETIVDNATIAADFDPADRAQLGHHWMAAPCVTDRSEQGAIFVTDSAHPFTEEDESLLTLLARMTTSALLSETLLEQTRSTAARLAAVVNSSPAAIVTLDRDLRIVNANPAADALFDWDEAEDADLPPDLDDCLGLLVAQAATTGQAMQRDCTVEIRGVEHTLLMMLAPVGGPGTVADGFVLVITDETERQQLIREFQQAQRMEAVGRLAGGIAHDFNNLLTVILGYADGMLRRLPDDDDNRARVAAIHRAGSRGADLTKRLLTISRHDVSAPIVLEPIAVIHEVRDMIERIVGESINVVVQPGGEGARVRIDKLQLEQMLLNIASNARDAMPDGGDIIIAVRRRGADARRTEALRADPDAPPTVEVRITDYGTGMDAETLARCLDPMFTTKDPGSGTGLGLSTVYGIATQAGGDVRVTSAPGLGTTVRLLLPEVTDDLTTTEESPLPQSGAQLAAGTETVLVVDDEHEILEMVGRILTAAGYHPLLAGSGAEAMKCYEAEKGSIDLLVTDVAMPGMSGGDLAAALQADQPLPVLFMSGYAERLEVRQQQGTAASSFISKPFTPESLLTAVRRALQRRAAGQPRR